MRNLIIIFIIIVFVVIVSLFSSRSMKAIGVKNQFNFDSTNIQGKVSWVGIKNQGIAFRIESNDVVFVFIPNYSLIENRSFHSAASIGDSIDKKAYSDTLRLFKAEKIYLFTFRRP